MRIPEPNNSISALIDKHHERQEQGQRGHLGASLLGHPCDRYLWLSFRWAVIPKFPGRILRLFRRGHMEEATLVSDLRAIGIDLRHTGRDQKRVDFGAHVSGSIDAIAESGVPESPNKRHVVEFKTHSLKSFADLEKHGVQKSKPQHYAQMQVYMAGTGIDRALYVAVCKDDDRLHTERIRYDEEAAKRLIERGHRIALAERMPEPISADPSWYQCKFCDAKDLCHSTKLTQEVNCRTCAHSTPTPESKWHCARWDDAIPFDNQQRGCDSHVLHPDLVPWPMGESDKEWSAVYVVKGLNVINGEDGYKSSELIANAELCASGAADEWKAKFPGARVVG